MTSICSDDLRDFISEAKNLGEFRLIEGADWNLEIGAITELQSQIPSSPLLMFDSINGYKPGFRVVSNVLNTYKRIALALGLPLDADGFELVQAWRHRISQEFKQVPPVEVTNGPVKENVYLGDDVDLSIFPAPKWHENDGGRFIGTGCVVILKDPDEGWVNLGCYRVQVHGKNTASIHINLRRHGSIIRKKYWSKGQSAPVAVVCGEDPLLFLASVEPVPWGIGEYNWAGWVRGRPVQVIRGKVTGLPIPASAEIVLEGEILPPDQTIPEGPMGEWLGYYSSAFPRLDPVFKVNAVLHRNDPIILGAPVNVGPHNLQDGTPLQLSATIWNELDKHVPGIKGVWIPIEGRGSMFIVVSVQQMYAGHAKRAGIMAMELSDRPSKYVIVVDDDIDPSDISEVLWAMATRCDPQDAIDIIRGCPAHADPATHPDKKARGELTTSKAIICACKPFTWMDKFPRCIKASPELLQRVKNKYQL